MALCNGIFRLRSIPVLLSCYRKLRGLTQEKLAGQAGLVPAFICHLEAINITKVLSLDALFDIAAVLEVSTHKFLLFEDD